MLNTTCVFRCLVYSLLFLASLCGLWRLVALSRTLCVGADQVRPEAARRADERTLPVHGVLGGAAGAWLPGTYVGISRSGYVCWGVWADYMVSHTDLAQNLFLLSRATQ